MFCQDIKPGRCWINHFPSAFVFSGICFKTKSQASLASDKAAIESPSQTPVFCQQKLFWGRCHWWVLERQSRGNLKTTSQELLHATGPETPAICWLVPANLGPTGDGYTYFPERRAKYSWYRMVYWFQPSQWDCLILARGLERANAFWLCDCMSTRHALLWYSTVFFLPIPPKERSKLWNTAGAQTCVHHFTFTSIKNSKIHEETLWARRGGKRFW